MSSEALQEVVSRERKYRGFLGALTLIDTQGQIAMLQIKPLRIFGTDGQELTVIETTFAGPEIHLIVSVSTPNTESTPFDLAAAMRGDPVQCRDGTPVRILAFDRMHSTRPIVGLCQNNFARGGNEQEERTHTWDTSGFSQNPRTPSSFDLVMAPKGPEIAYLNIYPDFVISAHQSEQAARDSAKPHARYVAFPFQLPQ